jgi:hypothetical protein
MSMERRDATEGGDPLEGLAETIETQQSYTAAQTQLSTENLDVVTEANDGEARTSGRFRPRHEHHIVAGWLGKLAHDSNRLR